MMRALAMMVAVLAAPAAAQDIGFDIRLHFDPAARSALQEKGEMVVISAVFSGEPAKGNVLPLDETGMIYLGAQTFVVWPMDQTVHLGGGLGAAPIGSVVVPLVNVNVYSARFTDEDNLLDCGIVDGPAQGFATAAQRIDCKLIGG